MVYEECDKVDNYLIKKINSLEFKKCEDIKCGDILLYPIKGWKNKNVLSSVRFLLGAMCAERVKISYIGKPDTLFLFSNAYWNRNDYYANFDEIRKLSENHVFAEPGKIKIHIHLKYILLAFSWLKTMKVSGIDLNMSMYCVGYLLRAYADYELVDKYLRKNNVTIKQFVSFCDVHYIDSFFTQKYNMKDITTITLQHGAFTSTSDPWPFSGSRSKYFIGANNFSADEARLSGHKNTLLVGGLYSFVGKKLPLVQRNSECYSIGVFLDAEINREDNIRTIKTITEYHRKYGKLIKIKFHPSSDIKSYENLIGRHDIACIGNEMNVIEFCMFVDVIIARNSTTLMEAVQFGKSAYIIHDENQINDMFIHVNMLKFTTADELHNLIDLQSKEQMEKQYEEARNYFCFDGDITNRYKEIFEDLRIS